MVRSDLAEPFRTVLGEDITSHALGLVADGDIEERGSTVIADYPRTPPARRRATSTNNLRHVSQV